MASLAVIQAFQAYLDASWTATPRIGPNSLSGRPSGREPFLALQFPVAVARQASFGAPGSNVFREEGAARLVVHVEVGSGVDQAATWAEQLSTLFRNARFGGVQTSTPTPPVQDDRNEDGGYYRVSVSVPYTYDAIG